jgi:cytoskeleton protein RodZ
MTLFCLDGSPIACSTAMEASVAEIGGDLRRARIARKRSVEDIARATKINPTLVRALENEAFERLPGGLFTRGYLRAYAREVGLDPEEMVSRYRAEFEGVPAENEDVPPQPQAPAMVSARSGVAIEDDTARSRQIQLLQLCIILLVVALYFAVSRRPKPEAQTDVKPVAPVAAFAKADKPVATNGTVVPEPARPMTLELRPQGPCWIEATARGQRVFGNLMDAGQRATITINEDVTLRVGDPAAFGFAIDGVEGRSLGEAGRPVTVHIDRTNYKTFLKSQP